MDGPKSDDKCPYKTTWRDEGHTGTEIAMMQPQPELLEPQRLAEARKGRPLQLPLRETAQNKTNQRSDNADLGWGLAMQLSHSSPGDQSAQPMQGQMPSPDSTQGARSSQLISNSFPARPGLPTWSECLHYLDPCRHTHPHSCSAI